jgi:hypothetical protein
MTIEEKIKLIRGDIFFVRSNSRVKGIFRYFSRLILKKQEEVDYIGLVVTDSKIRTARVVVDVGYFGLKLCQLWAVYGPPNRDFIAIYRAKNLSQEALDKIVEAATSQVGKAYGIYNRIYPRRSCLVAYAYKKVGKHFGDELGKATLDDIYNFTKRNLDKYEEIRPLTALT